MVGIVCSSSFSLTRLTWFRNVYNSHKTQFQNPVYSFKFTGGWNTQVVLLKTTKRTYLKTVLTRFLQN